MVDPVEVDEWKYQQEIVASENRAEKIEFSKNTIRAVLKNASRQSIAALAYGYGIDHKIWLEEHMSDDGVYDFYGLGNDNFKSNVIDLIVDSIDEEELIK